MAYENKSNSAAEFRKCKLPDGVTRGTPGVTGKASKPSTWEGARLPDGVTMGAPTEWSSVRGSK